jgi:hypothetical protein
VWTNRPGVEYMWWNDVETKPGLGYPKRWEDQEHGKAGWELDRRGRLRLKAGGWIKKLLTIYANPDLPQIDDYYEPWAYDYEKLITSPLSERDPVARARSQLTARSFRRSVGAPTGTTAWPAPRSGSTRTRSPPESRIRSRRPTASRYGIPDGWLDAARGSPVYALAHRCRVALPLHPECRTLPTVWYVPPLSPFVNTLETDGYEANPDDVFPAIEKLRIPVDYLANLLTAGDADVIRDVLLPPGDEAWLHAEARRARRTRLGDGRAGGDERGGRRRHVPAARHWQVRGALRDPQSARRARGDADAAARHLRSRLRGWPWELRNGRARVGPRGAGIMLGDESAQLDIVKMAGGPAGAEGAAVKLRSRRTLGLRQTYKLCSLLLCYPDDELLAARAGLAATAASTAPSAAVRALERFCRCWEAAEPSALQQHYVEIFDLHKRCGPYLSFYGEGDRRARGVALLRLKRMYRAAACRSTARSCPITCR